jgi:hypothetical protein
MCLSSAKVVKEPALYLSCLVSLWKATEVNEISDKIRAKKCLPEIWKILLVWLKQQKGYRAIELVSTHNKIFFFVTDA